MLVCSVDTAIILGSMVVREKDMEGIHRNLSHRHLRVHGLFRGDVGISTLKSP